MRPRRQLPKWLSNRILVAASLLVVSVGLLFATQQGWFGLSSLRTGLLSPLTPVQELITSVYGGLFNRPSVASDVEALQARVADLEAQVTELTADNIRLRELETQYNILAALLDYARSNPTQRYLTADVIGRDESLFLRFVLLNKGSRDGVARGMPVVTDQGLVGVVTEATANACKVLLITDSSSAVNVRVQESRAEGVISGQESGELRLNFIPVDVDLQPGHRVITSGLGGQFPANIVIGTVASVRKRTFEVFQEADVKSAVDFTRLETVLIITNFEPPALQPLLSTPAPP